MANLKKKGNTFARLSEHGVGLYYFQAILLKNKMLWRSEAKTVTFMICLIIFLN